MLVHQRVNPIEIHRSGHRSPFRIEQLALHNGHIGAQSVDLSLRLGSAWVPNW
jgi:hypothetical protein